MSNGDDDKFERLIKEHNISDLSVEEWKLEKTKKKESNSYINKLEKLYDKNRTEMDYETAKQHLDYLLAIYKDDSKMFAKEVERRKIPDEMLDMWREEMAEEFILEGEEL